MIRRILKIFTMVCFLGITVISCKPEEEEETKTGSEKAPIELTVDKWTNGEIVNKGDEQWFKFVATASTQRVYFKFSTLTNLYVSLYDGRFNQIGSTVYGSGNAGYTDFFEKSLTKGNTYHIKVTGRYSPYTGSYWIGFTDSPMQPETVITSLNKNTWLKGDMIQPSSGGTGEQWFKFRATANTQNIYVKFGALTYLYVFVYDSSYNQIGDKVYLRGNTGSVESLSKSLTVSTTYYIKVTGYSSSYSGTYWIGFTDSPMQPETVITTLTENTWLNGNIIQPSSGGTGEQWFTFRATATTQNVYVKFSTLTGLNAWVYDSSYNQIGERVAFFGDTGSVKSFSKSLIAGATYYIEVAGANDKSGTYWLTFNSTGNEPQ